MINIPDSENLTRKAFWLCRLRWFAAVGILISTTITMFFINLQLNFPVLFLIAGLLILSNILNILFLRSFRSKRDDKNILKVRNNINFQIVSDFIFLTVLLHFSGGIENPFIIFYIFHMVISSILLEKKCTYIHTSIGIILFASLAITEYFGVIQHHSINKYISSLIENDPIYLLFALLIFAATSYLVVYITSSLSGKLRTAEQKLKNANMDLLEKDQIKNEYVKRLTHDIKGHIAAIQSNIEVVKNEYAAPIDSVNLEYINKAYSRTLKLNEFIYDLLSLTNMRLNNKYDKQTIDIHQLLSNTINSNQAFAESKNILLSLKANISNPFYSGIRQSIEEVINNLLQNAIKYTHEGGKVQMQAISDEKTFSIVVTDTGYGIPENELAHIFDEFFRASNIKDTIKDGTGLGLSLVKAIVDRHSGKIYAESTIGKGSTFTVILPHL